jgi:zinc protease
MPRPRMTPASIAAAIGLATSLAVLPAVAQSPMATVPDLNLAYDTFTLDNGLKVIVHEDRKAPVVAVSIWYRVGSKNEPAGKTGFAHLFEHLMFYGSEHHDGEWFLPMQQAGATSVNGSTWLDRTNYYQTVPTPALDLALWMESDRMGHLLGAVTQTKLDTQRGVVQNEKRQRDNSPYGRVNYNLYEGLFPPGHPYRHSTIGSMEDLNAASLEDVHGWFKQYYGPNNAILVLAGDIDVDTARTAVERYFGDIPAGPDIDAYERWVPVKTTSSHETMHDEVPAVLANRAWAVAPRADRDTALLTLAADVLGRGRNSRFYLDLIYRRQLASDVSISVVPFELASVFDLAVTLNPGQPASVATEAIDRLMAEFLEQGPSAEELERAVASINSRIIRGLEQVNDKATALAEGVLYHGDPLFVQTYLEWINSATPEDVRDAARRWLGPGWHQVDVVPAGKYANAAQGVDRSTGLPPIPTDMPTLSFPEISTGTLSNGVRLVVAERHALPIVELSLQFDAGYAADAGGKLGVSAFTMAMLERGTQTRSALEIAAEEERLGANITSGANLDASVVALSALKTQLAPSIALWADVVRNPTFSQEEIDRLKGEWRARIAQEKAQPDALALRLLPPVLYGAGHAYAIPFTGSGTAESIDAITRDDLAGFHSAWLRPDNATIFVVGDTTLAEISAELEEVFAGWSAPSTPVPTKNVADVGLPESPRIILVDRPGAPQSLILGGLLAPGLGHERDLAYEAMNLVLGGTSTSRIYMNLREDKGWSYGAYTSLQNAKGTRPYLTFAPVQTDRTADSLREIAAELQAITSTRPITEEEMSLVIAGRVRQLPGSFQTSTAVLNSLVTSARYGRPLDYAAALTEKYEALTLSELQDAAAELVHPDRVTWVIVGDVRQIRGPIEQLGIAPVEVWNDDGEPVR